MFLLEVKSFEGGKLPKVNFLVFFVFFNQHYVLLHNAS